MWVFVYTKLHQNQNIIKNHKSKFEAGFLSDIFSGIFPCVMVLLINYIELYFCEKDGRLISVNIDNTH